MIDDSAADDSVADDTAASDDAAADAAFAAAADELYALPAEEFTAARNEHEKRAKAAGDKALAARIKALGKPNAAAALANQLVREHPQEVQPLVELGEDLRAAAAAGDGKRLRELTKAQRLVIAALIDQARQDARAAGRKAPDAAVRALVDTLRAAITDAGAAQELLAGRLTAPLYRSGLESVGGGSDDAAPAAAEGSRITRPGPAKRPATRAAATDEDPPTAQETELQAEQEWAEAARRRREIADAATDLAAEAGDRAEAADSAVDEARSEVERLQSELVAAESALSAAEAAARQAHSELTKADRAAAVARRRAESD